MLNEGESVEEISTSSAWDIAMRYHEYKSRASLRNIAPRLRKLSARAIMERAIEILGSVVHPMVQKSSPWDALPSDADHVDFDLEETLDQSPFAVSSVVGNWDVEYPITAQDIWMSYSVPQRQSLVLSVDTSLSMTGEKLALTAVALAVVLLQFPDDPIGIIAFENQAKVLKSPEERISIQELIERFLDVPAQGYTHLEDGLKSSLRMVKSIESIGRGRPPSVVLLTDGKYTAGRDPVYLAPKFSHLVVMKMGRERASLELCQELARQGRGALKEVAELDSLPTVMYSVVKDLLRGTS